MLEAWFFIAATLLIVSGGSKLIDPGPTRGALTATRLPDTTLVVWMIGGVEIASALAGTIVGGWASLSVAATYTGFAGFVAYALMRKIPLQSCGCFGKADTPPTWGHLVFNLVSAVAAVAIAVRATAPIDLLADQPGWGIPYLAFVGLGVWAVYLLLAELPLVLKAGR